MVIQSLAPPTLPTLCSAPGYLQCGLAPVSQSGNLLVGTRPECPIVAKDWLYKVLTFSALDIMADMA